MAGNTRWLAVTRSHKQPPTLFAAVIGRPGSGKSTPLDFILQPVHATEARYYREWETEKELAEKMAEEAEPKRKPKKPTLKRCLLDDTTTEALCRVLAENQRGGLMARDELAALVTGMNQYREGGKGSDRQIFLKIWSASTVKVDRSKFDGIPMTVRRPLLCIVGGIQPQVIEWLRGEQKGERPPPDDGFFDRFLVSYPSDMPAVGEQWREVPEHSAQAWAMAVEALVSLQMDRHEETGDRLPRFLPLADDGRAEWEILTREHAEEVNAPGFSDWLRGPWSKLVPGYAGRLALVVHLLRWCCGEAGGEAVDGESVHRAADLVCYFKAHARKVYVTMAADPRVQEARRVLQWLARNPDLKQFSRRDAYRNLRAAFKSPAALDAPLWRLADHGFLRALDTHERHGPGRKATQAYEISPLWTRDNIDTIDEMHDEP
jgi:hypothetical protein